MTPGDDAPRLLCSHEMRLLPACLAAALAAPVHAAPARVEIMPELGAGVHAPAAAPSIGAASVVSAAGALAPAPVLAAPALAPALAAAPVMAAPAAAAPAAAAPAKADSRPLLIKSLASPALDVSKLAGESGRAAEADFNARAQLDAPAALSEAVSAPAASASPRGKGRLSLARPAKAPAAAPAVEEAPLDLVATPQSLRALSERGETRLLLQSDSGRWSLAPREDGSPAWPTPAELSRWAGAGGRAFIASRSGLLEWNTAVPAGAAEKLGSAAARLALRVPGLSGFVLARAGVAARRTAWDRVQAGGLDAGEAPLNEEVLVSKTIPALVALEFPVIAARLGRRVDAAYAADVLARTNGWRMFWHSASTYKDHPDHVGIPDGHFRSDFGIRLMVKPDWRRLKDLSANYRPLFAHEYVHWLQNEGFVSTKYGAEIAAVAVEILRAIELVGLDEVRGGRAGTVHAGNMSSFDGGREWAREGFRNETTAYMKGSLAGAAYEAGVAAGRPEAAWEFLNLVVAGKGALEPAAAWAKVVGGAR